MLPHGDYEMQQVHFAATTGNIDSQGVIQMTTTSIVRPYTEQIEELVRNHGENLERYRGGVVRLYPSYGDPKVYLIGDDVVIICLEIVTVSLLHKTERVAVFGKMSENTGLRPRVLSSDVASCDHAILLSTLTDKEQAESGGTYTLTYLQAQTLILNRAIFGLTEISYLCNP